MYVHVAPFSYKSLGRFFIARHLRLPLFDLERVHILHDTRNLQRATFILDKVKEEQYFLNKLPAWEKDGDSCL